MPAPGPKKTPRRGLAVLDEHTLVLSSETEDKLYLLDLKTGATTGELGVPAPTGLAVDGAGTLYAISESAVGRVDRRTGAFTPIAKGLDEPKMLACDTSGNVYVSLMGATMQVWKLSPQGKVRQRFGKAGGRPSLGSFDPAGMLRPYAIAVDKHGRLWVCENDRQPKRYSVWNPNGTLWKEFFGSLPYSTGVYVDPRSPEHVYAENVRYLVDYAKGTWRPDATILREREEEGVKLPQVAPHTGARIVIRDGRSFLAVGSLGAKLALYEEVDGVFQPRLTYCGYSRRKKGGALWLDRNNDGHVQQEEMGQVEGTQFGRGWNVGIDQRLDLYTWKGDRWTEPRAEGRNTQPYTIMRLDFAGFAENGALQYAEAPVAVVTDPDGGSPSEICVDADGSIYVLVSGGMVGRGERAQGTGGRVVKFSPTGEKLWEYHNVHCGFAWTSGSYTPGFVVAAFRNHMPDHPTLLPITGYYGQYFLLDKAEGLFIDALGQDQRSAYTLDHTMVLTETFNGSIWQHPETGKTYFAGGDCDARIWEVTGLEGLRRTAVSVAVPPDAAAQAEKNAAQNRQAQLAVLARNTGRKSATLHRLAAAAVGGDDTEWQGIPALPIGEPGPIRAQVKFGYDEQHLYARFDVTSTVPFVNTPTDPKLLFKSGSAVELCLTPHINKRQVKAHNVHPMLPGDLRLVVARTPEGRLVATRYRPRIKDAKKPRAAYFETQASGREAFEEIVEWNDLAMHYRPTDDGYAVELALPWEDLGIQPRPGARFLADAGVITGNAGGTRNAVRAMWADTAPEVGVNNDIPTESRLHPNFWGTVVID